MRVLLVPLALLLSAVPAFAAETAAVVPNLTGLPLAWGW